MADYRDNLDRYRNMKNRPPQYEAVPAVRDRILGIGMMLICGFLALVLCYAALAGVYETTEETTDALWMSLVFLALVYAGYRFYRRAEFYRKARKYLDIPGSIPLKHLAVNLGYPEKTTLRLVRDISRAKYYRTLSLSEDGKLIQIARAEAPATKVLP